MEKIFIILIYAVISVCGVTCFKLGSEKGLSVAFGSGKFSLEISWISVFGLCLYVSSFLIYMAMVSKSQLSRLAPVSTGMVYLLTLLVATLVFHEKQTWQQALGCVLILCGVLLISMKQG